MDKHFPSLKYLTIYYLGGIVFLLAEYLITRRLPSVEALVSGRWLASGIGGSNGAGNKPERLYLL